MSDWQSTIFSIQPGDTLHARYRVERILGRGGMGVVWHAQDLQLGKPVAVKLLPSELIHDQNALERLKAEARRGQSLAHPGIVTLHDFQQDPARGNVAFLVMELVEGEPLSNLLKDHRQGLPLERVIRWARQLGEAIDFAHSKDILHRDIKPGNVMIDARDNARLIDFGIGREVRNTMSQVSVRPDSSGTPAYMSPQQLMGENHPTNDIYSLAATMYECLSGAPPFRDGHLQTQIMYKLAAPIAGLPEHVNKALLAGLAKETHRRPASAVQMARAMAKAPAAITPAPAVNTLPPPASPAISRPTLAPREAARYENRPLAASPKRQLKILWVVGAIVVLTLIWAVLYTNHQSRQRAALQTTAAAAQAAEQRQAQARAAEEARQREAARLAALKPKHLDRKTVTLAPGVTAEFVYIDAPTVAPDGFLMGSPAGEAQPENDETQHRVKLTKGFWMQTTEVTQGQWQAVMGSNPAHFKSGSNYPVEQVNWNDCQEFVGKLRQRGISARLPTEAEWEFACRAGTTTPFSFGNTISTSQASYDGRSTYGNGQKGEYRQRTTPVGSFPANAWGLHDMHGNVWEWCQDWYGGYPSSTVTDPVGPQTGSYRVLRGGSWGSDPWNLRSALRNWISPAYRFNLYGLRFTLDSE